MRILFGLLSLSLSLTCFADTSHFSSSSQVLAIPALVIDGSTYHENVLLELDIDNGQFTILSSTAAEFPTGPQLVQLDFNNTKLLLDASTLSFSAVQSDSRCPLSVVCITAGFVELSLQLRVSTSAQLFEFNLQLEGNGPDLNDTGTEVNGLFFRLREVNPYPANELGIEDEEYNIVLEYSSQAF